MHNMFIQPLYYIYMYIYTLSCLENHVYNSVMHANTATNFSTSIRGCYVRVLPHAHAVYNINTYCMSMYIQL